MGKPGWENFCASFGCEIGKCRWLGIEETIGIDENDVGALFLFKFLLFLKFFMSNHAMMRNFGFGSCRRGVPMIKN